MMLTAKRLMPLLFIATGLSACQQRPLRVLPVAPNCPPVTFPKAVTDTVEIPSFLRAKTL